MKESKLLTPSRREFIQASAAAAAFLSAPSLAHASGSDRIRVGLIGCGGRGTGAASNCVASSPGVEIVAMGDLFADRLDSSRESLKTKLGDAYQVKDLNCYVGFDAFQHVIAAPVDMVILATPPHFRPEHLAAAVKAKKHVFMEKPVAVDPFGVRSVLASGELADDLGLGIVAGTQRRHQAGYVETMKRVRAGDIGEIVAAQCYWNQGGLWMHERQPEWSDMEWQLRNWLYFTWLSGDHICEQHIHNIDVVNWAIGTHPERAMGMGGREVRTDPAYGNIFDHFAIEFEYPGDVRVQSYCRQIDNCATNVSEKLVGTKGVSNPSGTIRGETNWRFDGESANPYQQEHTDLIASIRAGEPLNEARQVAESTLTAIMGRMSAYTGKRVTWEQALNSKLDLRPAAYAFGDLEVRPVAVPGLTELI